MRRIPQSYAVVLASVAFMLGALAIVDPGRIGPIDGVRFADRVALCNTESCDSVQDITLPHIPPFRYVGGTEQHAMSVLLTAAPDGHVQALFIPK